VTFFVYNKLRKDKEEYILMQSNLNKVVYLVTVELPNNQIKRFRSDNYNGDMIIDRFENIYGKENIKVTYKVMEK